MYKNAVITIIDILGFKEMIDNESFCDVLYKMQIFQSSGSTDQSEFFREFAAEMQSSKKIKRSPLYVYCASDMVIRYCFEDECTDEYTYRLYRRRLCRRL